MYVQRSSYLDRVRAARFPGSKRSSLATGSAPPRYQDGAAPDLPGKKRKIRIPKIKSLNKPNNPVRQPGVVITPISLKSLSTLSVVISAARQPDSPSSHRRSGWSWSPAGEEEGADPSGRGGWGGVGSLSYSAETLPPPGLYGQRQQQQHPPLVARVGICWGGGGRSNGTGQQCFFVLLFFVF